MFGRSRGNKPSENQEQKPAEVGSAQNEVETTVDEVDQESEKQKDTIEALRSRLRAAHFADIISVLMRSPAYNEISLGQLRQRIVPPFLANQYLIAHAKQKDGGKPAFPAGVAFWARVSDEVDARLTNEPGTAAQLTPQEWKSGNNLWVIEIVAHEKVASMIIGQLRSQVFGGNSFKVRAKDSAGKFQIHELPKVKAEQPHANEVV